MRWFLAILLATQNAFAVSNPPTATERQYLQFKNMMRNGGAESGLTGWTATTTDPTITTTAANVFDGLRAVSWDPAGAESLRSPSWTPNANSGGNGVGFCRIKTADADYTFEIFDGTNVIATVNVPSTGGDFRLVYLNFPVVGSTSYSVRVTSAGNDDVVYIDDCGMGYAEGWNIADISQAEFVGGALTPATTNCLWSSTSTSYADFAADADCPAPTLSGSASAPATKVPGVTFTNLPAGEYHIVARSQFRDATLDSNGCGFAISDGTTRKGQTGTYAGSNIGSVVSSIATRFAYNTSQSNITFQMQVRSDNAGNTCTISQSETAMEQSFEILVYRYPLASQIAVKADTTRWFLDLNISGANVDLSNADQTAYIAPNNASLTMTVNTAKGSSPAGISCSSTNDNTVGATTCPTGSEELGFVANFPRAGLVDVCYHFTHLASSSSFIYTAFQLVRTANGSQTITEEGGAKVSSAAGNSNTNVSNPLNLCGTFQIPSAAKHTIRLMYEQDISGTVLGNQILADASASNGQRDVKITVRYIDQAIPAPLIKQSVVTSSEGVYAVESLSVTTTCTANPCTINRQSGDWATSVTRSGTGTYVINIKAGAFLDNPVCVCNAAAGSQSICSFGYGTQSNTVKTITTTSVSAALTDTNFDVICSGPR